MAKKAEQTFKEKIDRLEIIADQLEEQDLELEAAIALYEEGVQLSTICLKTLEDAELKVSNLKESIAKSNN